MTFTFYTVVSQSLSTTLSHKITQQLNSLEDSDPTNLNEEILAREGINSHRSSRRAIMRIKVLIVDLVGDTSE